MKPNEKIHLDYLQTEGRDYYFDSVNQQLLESKEKGQGKEGTWQNFHLASLLILVFLSVTNLLPTILLLLLAWIMQPICYLLGMRTKEKEDEEKIVRAEVEDLFPVSDEDRIKEKLLKKTARYIKVTRVLSLIMAIIAIVCSIIFLLTNGVAYLIICAFAFFVSIIEVSDYRNYKRKYELLIQNTDQN